MVDVFTALSPAHRAAFSSHYLAYLRKRDGVPDRAAHRFDVRERFFADIDTRPVRRTGPPVVDQAVFDRHHAKARASEPLDEPTLWALCVAKSNRGERYGVEHSFMRKPPSAGDVDRPESYIEVEEFYHTRILRDALAVIGVQMEMLTPSLGQRVLIHAMIRLPETLSRPLVMCGEVVGVALFDLLLRKARALFADQPEPLARIEALFGQILVDEVGHVHFVRSQLDQRSLDAARRMLPMVARGVCDGIPELYRLFGRERLMAEFARADVDGAAQSYADRFTPLDAAAEPVASKPAPERVAAA